MPFEDTFEIHPVILHVDQQVKGLVDLVDVLLPVVDLVIELLVVGGALVLGKLLGVVFDQLDDVFSGGDLVQFLILVLFDALDHKLSLRVLFPHLLDVLEGILNGKLLLSVSTQITDLFDVIDQLKIENLFNIEGLVFFIEVFLDLDSELLPVAISH